MWQKNNGSGDANILQNRFTAYVVMAVRRRRKDYLTYSRNQYIEYLPEEMLAVLDHGMEQDMLLGFPLFAQIGNRALLIALKSLSERERRVFLGRVLGEESFEKLAEELGIGYKGVAAIFYRTIRKLKDKMKEVDE